MRCSLFLILFNLIWLSICAQPENKKPVSMAVLKDQKAWGKILGPKISMDGKTISYIQSDNNGGRTTVFKSTGRDWEYRLPGGYESEFSRDNKWIVFQLGNDSLGLFNIIRRQVTFLAGVRSYKLMEVTATEQLVCQGDSGLSIRSLNRLGSPLRIPDVSAYNISACGLVVANRRNGLFMFDIRNHRQWQISHTANNQDFVFDASGRQLCYLFTDKTGHFILKYYKVGTDSAITVYGNHAGDLPLRNGELFYFCRDGSKFFFKTVSTTSSVLIADSTVKVHLWLPNSFSLTYKNNDLHEEHFINSYVVNQNKVMRLTSGDNSDYNSLLAFDAGGSFLLTAAMRRFSYTELWDTKGLPDIYVTNTANGERTLIKSHWNGQINNFSFSPNGKFILYFDSNQGNYYTYNLTNGKASEISSKVPAKFYDEDYDRSGVLHSFNIDGAPWLKGDSRVILYDKFDIWCIDPSGMQPGICLTKGYGRENRITLRLVRSGRGDFQVASEKNLVFAINQDTKETGFTKLSVRNTKPLQKFLMSPVLYYLPHLVWDDADNRVDLPPPIKAANEEIYLSYRMNSNEAPNLYLTKDFRTFVKMTDFQPQQDLNGVKSELIKIKIPGEAAVPAILYKPENFDQGKKYPLIVNLYERPSNTLNNFIGPGLTAGQLNISLMVSNGYLVLAPDMHYNIGAPGKSVVNTVRACLNDLSLRPYIDTARMGLSGISFGGSEVNYLITQVGNFKCASSIAGVSDMVSHYNSLFAGASAQFYYESGQGRIGKSLWDDPQAYWDNSPMVFANRITTPLLINENRLDEQIPWQQGLEWFMALRRLGKKVWMLEYDDEAHGLFARPNQIDLTEKIKEFFDHYLMGAEMPGWMYNRNYRAGG